MILAHIKKKIEFQNFTVLLFLNEWMMHLYNALLCIAVHPKHFYNHVGGLSSTF